MRLFRFLRVDGFLILVTCLGLATAALMLLGYRATREWQRMASISVERRASEVLALLATALDRDMKGAQVSVLLPLNQQTLVVDPPYDLAERFARAFARFPYPESFFAWRSGTDGDHVYFFNRSNRLPRWDVDQREPDPYPVAVLTDPAPPQPIVAEAMRQARIGARFGLFEVQIAGRPYQVVVHYIYNGNGLDTEEAPPPFGFVGFTVDLEWARREYFASLIAQVRSLGGSDEAIELRVADEHDVLVASGPTAGGQRREQLKTRVFPLVFFDRTLLSSLGQRPERVREWKAMVNTASDSTLRAAGRGAERSFVMMSLAAMATIAALVLTFRNVKESTRLTAMKSDFVSSVTHEIKTPLALIQLMSETLEQRRYTNPEVIDDYARLLARESKNLTRLLDNLLMIARVSDTSDPYTFESVDLVDIVDDALDHFHALLTEQGFDVTLDVADRVPPIRLDRTAMRHVIENLVDNAIKYSGERRAITVRSSVAGTKVRLELADRGVGIPQDELPRIFDKFFRGRSSGRKGSGLGLAIVSRIVRDHGGAIDVQSRVGYGTSVLLEFPAGYDA